MMCIVRGIHIQEHEFTMICKPKGKLKMLHIRINLIKQWPKTKRKGKSCDPKCNIIKYAIFKVYYHYLD